MPAIPLLPLKRPIAIFYHCVFHDTKDSIWTRAPEIVRDQMSWARDVGLLKSANQIHCGINGGFESAVYAETLLPENSLKVPHGLQCKNELRTIKLLEDWLPHNPGWDVLYFHSKGATRPTEMNARWRTCMMRNLVNNWRQCVEALEYCDSVGCHWQIPPQTPIGQHIWAGNFWWATSNYLRTLPSMMETQRLKLSGIDSLESRYEAEVWIGNGPKLPRVRDLHPNGLFQCP